MSEKYNYKICKACGTRIDQQTGKDVCGSCESLFETQTREVMASEDSQFLRHCKYCSRPILCYSSVIYHSKSGDREVKRKTKRQYCDIHYSQCQNCGRPILFKRDAYHIPTTCSKECRTIIQAQSFHETCQQKYGVDAPMQSKEIAKKYRQNCLDKYGVDNVLKVESIKDKIRETNLFRYGTEFPSQSDVVKSKSMATNMMKYGMTYGGHTKESDSKRRSTNLDRYGVENPLGNKDVRDKMRSTNLDRYGTEYASSSYEVKQRILNTFQEKYGGNSPFSDETIKKKRDDTWSRKYGGHPSRCEDVLKKRKKTFEKHYGYRNGTWPESILNKSRRTCLERYGTNNVNSLPEIQDKKRSTFIKKYGVDHPMKTDSVKNKMVNSRMMRYAENILDPVKRANYLLFKKDPRSYILDTFDHKPSLVEISETIGGLDPTTIANELTIEDHSLLGNYISSMERGVSEFLESVIDSKEISLHDRSIISPKEIDIYLPKYKFGIECNPTSTHNSSIHCFDKFEDPLRYDYHKAKSRLCADVGIRLFHVFGYEWNMKNEIIKSMIENILGKSSIRYYGRNLIINEVDFNTCKKFLESNHLQGSTNAKIRIGLYTKDNELVSLMTFNKMRNTMGKTSNNSEAWELSRFCNKLHSSVVGGASKLFKHFLRVYSPKEIISFSDIAHTSGELYKKLGFEMDSITDPSYVWANMNDTSYYNRVRCQKQNLRNLFKDQSLDINNKTEEMIMIEHGYVQVFDSGKIKWIWRNKGGEAL